MDSTAGSGVERSSPDRIRVLHVDDDPEFAEVTGTFLGRVDDRITTRTVDGADAAMERLREDDVDCIVSDYEMPATDGIEFLERVREWDPDIPFILFTGKGSETVASEAISAGVTDYLQKGGTTEKYQVLANRIANAVSKHRAEREVKRGFRAIEAANDGISLIDDSGEFVYVNPTYADVYGYEREELLGTNWERLYREEDVPRIYERMLPQAREGEWNGEVVGRRKDGTTVTVEQTLTYADEETLICAVSDLSGQKERQRELRARKRQLETIAGNLPVVLFALDDEGRVTLVEGSDPPELGLAAGDVVGEPVSEVWAEEPALVENCRKTLEGTAVHGVEDVGDRTFEMWCEPVADETTEDSAIGVVVDVTTRRERSRRIEGLHGVTRELMQATSDEEIAELAVEAASEVLEMPLSSVFVLEEGALEPVAATDRAAELIGGLPELPAGESVAWEVFEAGETETFRDVSRHPDRFNPETAVRGQIILPLEEYGVLHLSSTEVDAFDEIDVSLAQILGANVEEALNRVEREEDLQATNRWLQAVLDTVNARIFMKNTDGEYQVFNDTAREVMGVDDGREVTGLTAYDLVPEEVADRFTEYDRAVIEGGERIRREEEIPTPDGVRTHLTTKSPMFDEDGEVVGVCAVSTDITERKRRERELRQQNERLEEFSSIVSHDLRNPLNVAEMRLDLVRRECESDHIKAVEDAHDRMRALIEDLLALARTDGAVTDPDGIDLAAVAQNCFGTVETGEAELATAVDRSIAADPDRIRQLLENLFRNAVEHASRGEDVTITVGTFEGGFYVEDDGAGIPPGDRERVFERGYSTGEEGTGFGLAIVADVAEAHGWEVRATESETGGARFEITGVERSGEGG